MKKYIYLGILFICNLFITAQKFAWAESFGANGTNVVSTALDASGNTYILGNYSGTADFDPGPGVFIVTAAGFTDVFISKLDPAGNLIWAKTVGGFDYEIGKGMVLDNFGSLYITGTFADVVDFDPSPASATVASSGYYPDVFILKLDLSGNFMWVESVGGGGTDYVFNISLTNLGYLYITGSYSGGVDFNPSPGGTFVMTQGGTYILKLDLSGNFVWAKTVDHNITGLALDSQDNIYTYGEIYNTGDFDPGPGTYTIAPVLGSDVYICKWTGTGNFVWAEKIGGLDFDFSGKLEIDGSENLYISGSFVDVVDFDPGPATYTLNSSVDRSVFICKLDSAGNFIWARHLNAVALSSTGFQDYKLDGLAVDASANVYIAGGFLGTVDFDPGPATNTVTSKGNFDIFMVKLDASGNFNSLYSAGSNVKDIGADVCVSSGGDAYVAGVFGGTVDFDPDTAIFNLSSPNFRAFILKLSGPDVGINENAPGNQATIYPNPASDRLTIDQPGTQNTGFYIRDLFGRPVLSGRLDGQNQVDVGQLPAGAYLLQVGGSTKPFKLIKQ